MIGGVDEMADVTGGKPRWRECLLQVQEPLERHQEVEGWMVGTLAEGVVKVGVRGEPEACS